MDAHAKKDHQSVIIRIIELECDFLRIYVSHIIVVVYFSQVSI